jgi:TnpA family transposase
MKTTPDSSCGRHGIDSNFQSKYESERRRFEVPPAIVGIVQHDVSLEPIREGWDDLLRLAAAIGKGWRSATDVLERFGSAARGDRIYRAGHAPGQLLRTARIVRAGQQERYHFDRLTDNNIS